MNILDSRQNSRIIIYVRRYQDRENVREPTCFNHWNEHSKEPFEVEKRHLIEKSGITIYQYHNYPHKAPQDLICKV